MGVPASEVGYTIATTRRETTKVHKNMWWHWGKKKKQCFHIFLRPFDNYIIFFFQLPLSFQSSSINPFSPISPLIPSVQLSLGLPRFLLPGGRHFIISFGNLPSSILWTYPYHWSCFVLISSKRPCCTHFLFNNSIANLVLPGNSSRASPEVHFCGIQFCCRFCF